ncbi:hypothetical protein ACFWUP_06135 [Nocardia sp. NPDC058658]|uniref:hypothetical protein n=1 Tax=Nocardia sp. NPDC058658 TaxID=3346580 RepID=UPI003656B1DB
MGAHRFRRTAIALLAVAITTAGCGDIERALNRGGATPCGDYLDQDADTQRLTITKFIQDRRDNSEDLSPATVDVARGGINMLCSIPSNADVPIENATLTGLEIRIPPTR